MIRVSRVPFLELHDLVSRRPLVQLVPTFGLPHRPVMSVHGGLASHADIIGEDIRSTYFDLSRTRHLAAARCRSDLAWSRSVMVKESAQELRMGGPPRESYRKTNADAAVEIGGEDGRVVR